MPPRSDVRATALPPALRSELTLARGASVISFPRPGWKLVLATWALGPVFMLGTRTLLHRYRVRWDARDVVVDSWPRRRGVKVARAAVASIHRGRDTLTLRLVDGVELPIVVGRRVRDRDLGRAHELAAGLGVPFTDDSGAPVALPPARVVT